MAVAYVLMFVVVLATVCSCYPSKMADYEKEVMENGAKKAEVSIVIKSDSAIVRKVRSIIEGSSCPIGQGLTKSGECAPCQGQKLPGCPDVNYEDDYDD